MNYRFNLIFIFISIIVLSGCSQKSIDTVSDITYLLTGVPGAKHREQERQQQAKTTQAQIDRKADEIIEFKKTREYWIGRNIDELVEEWGNPYKTYARADGGRHVSYQRFYERTGDLMWGFEDHYCLTTFIGNSKGIVTSWKSSGRCHYIKE